VRFWMRAVLVWLGLLVLAILNGALREAWLFDALGRGPGLVASGLILSALILAVACACARWLDPPSAAAAWRLGLGWLALTLAFEFGFGRLQGRSWTELLAAYSFSDGNLWPVVLLVILVAPVLARRLRAGR